jgi:hypothetical protein
MVIDVAKSAIGNEGIEFSCKRPVFLSQEGPLEMLSREAAASFGRMCVHVLILPSSNPGLSPTATA